MNSKVAIIKSAATDIKSAGYDSSKSDANERLVLSWIINKAGSDSEIERGIDMLIDKGKISMDSVLDVIKQIIKKQNRTQHSFVTMDELSAFEADNDCGDFWYDYKEKIYHVYKY